MKNNNRDEQPRHQNNKYHRRNTDFQNGTMNSSPHRRSRTSSPSHESGTNRKPHPYNSSSQRGQSFQTSSRQNLERNTSSSHRQSSTTRNRNNFSSNQYYQNPSEGRQYRRGATQRSYPNSPNNTPYRNSNARYTKSHAKTSAFSASLSSAGAQNYLNSGNRKKNRIVLYIVVALLLIVLILAGRAIFFSPNNETEQDNSISTAVNNTTQEVSFTVSFAGDCTLGTDENFSYSGSFPEKYESVSPDYFLENFAEYFTNDDLTVVNMEGTLTEATTRQDKTFAFKGPEEYTKILTSGSVEAASLANNHSHDYGEESYTDTISALESAGISSFGYDRIAYVDVQGVKVALIGTYELALGAEIKDEMVNNIQSAQENGAQVIMVYLHWGTELETVPDSTQIELGHAAVDAGADLVIGSHPHVIQGYEKYNGRYIVYSLGNFCFGGNPNPTSKDCMVFQQTFTVRGNEVETDDNINVIPASVSSVSSYNNYQPTPAEGSEKERILAKIQESNDAIAQKSSF